MRTQLLCTFTTKKGYEDVVKEISNSYPIILIRYMFFKMKMILMN